MINSKFMVDSPKKVIIFGAFDHFHEGHRFFIKQAETHGEKLFIALTPDNVILEIKNRNPDNLFEKRKKRLEKEFSSALIISGDEKQGSWEVLKKHKPDIIALGYDQKNLFDALNNFLSESENYQPEVIFIEPFQPERYQSRFIRNPRKTQRIFGKIQSGKGEANILGFPTINIDLEEEIPSGIYAGKVHLHGTEYKAALYVGPEKDIIEAHMIDFKSSGELYGEWATIEIDKKIREVIRAKSLQDLKELIAKDIDIVKSLNSNF